MSDKNKIIQRLEIHYYFKDQTHSMDATVRNESERELIMLYKQIISQMSFDLKIETEAFNEGGLKQTFIFIGKSAAQIGLVLTLIQIGLSRFPVENKELTKAQIENLNTDTELKNAQIENTKTDTELKREQIKEQKRNSKDADLKTPDESREIAQEQYDTSENNYKMRWHASNFYKRISGYSKITKVSTKIHSNVHAKEVIVERKDFIQFIQISDNLPSITDEEALIDIISPVLKSGNFTWRGIYKGESISFEMKDDLYKASVLNKQVEFLNGTAIKCVLKLNRRINESGEIVVSKRQVLTVIETIVNFKASPTIQGEKFMRSKKATDNQIALNF